MFCTHLYKSMYLHLLVCLARYTSSDTSLSVLYHHCLFQCSKTQSVSRSGMKSTFTCISALYFLIYINPKVSELFAQPSPPAHLFLCLIALTFMCVNSSCLLKAYSAVQEIFPCLFEDFHRKIQILINFIKYCERK